jgi:serine/threonine-protein phosphatase 2A regulatory subunit A
VIGIEDLQ